MPHNKKFFSAIILLNFIICFFPFNEGTAAEPASFDLWHGFYRISYESVKLPGNETMGLSGLHYLIDLSPPWYIGAGGYGAITGDRGGFFTGGFNAGVRWRLGEKVLADAGLFLGSGGGAGAPQGGGLMLRPYAGGSYDFGTFQAGLQLARVDFPNGSINSNHICFQLDIPFETLLLRIPSADLISNANEMSLELERRPVGFSRNYLSPVFRMYFPADSVRGRDNRIKQETISLIGIEYGSFSSDRSSVFISAAGALSGNADGFAEIFAGTGYHLPLLKQRDGQNSRLFLNSRIEAGAAGGGNVDTGGGFVVRSMFGIEYRPAHQYAAGLSGGYILSPDGDFKAGVAGAHFVYHADLAVLNKAERIPIFADKLAVDNWRIGPGWETYRARVPRKENKSQPLSLMGLRVEREVNGTVSAIGQAWAAYEGEAGGYAVGILGLKLASPELLRSPASLFLEAAVGAAGGGGVLVGGGAVMRAAAGIQLAITSRISIDASYGVIRAVEDGLNSNVIQAGISYAFSTLSRKAGWNHREGTY